MRLIFRYMRPYWRMVVLGIFIKLLATMSELALPYILEHLIDEVVPSGKQQEIWLWGGVMILFAAFAWIANIIANRNAGKNAHLVSYDLRRDVFRKTIHLCGERFDEFGLPSLTSRMTSDSYNVQNFVRFMQTLCIRAPIMLFGGIIMTMSMNAVLSAILCATVPVLLLVVVTISRKGIPMYRGVQDKLDDVVRSMRENIAGIRVVKALSKTEYEKERFRNYNQAMTDADIRTSIFMAIPRPFMQLVLRIGLVLVVLVGAHLVNRGDMKAGVILAFLTYFNLVLISVMSINRMFMMASKASASASRMEQVLLADGDLPILECPEVEDDAFISFDKVNFTYDSSDTFEEQEQCLYDISFRLNKGESLGIIGPTGCGKTTIVNLLMRFYDADSGRISIGGRDVRSYKKEDLHRLFGVALQNDIIFMDSLRENIDFGRNFEEATLRKAIEEAQAAEFIDHLDDGLDHMADIKGANLSGGQKQRLLISRALAGTPEILILDDSSSALDYKTDASLRKAIYNNHGDSAIIMVAQRVSSIMNMTKILVLDNGHCIGYGDHETLLQTCPEYKEIYTAQMGALD